MRPHPFGIPTAALAAALAGAGTLVAGCGGSSPGGQSGGSPGSINSSTVLYDRSDFPGVDPALAVNAAGTSDPGGSFFLSSTVNPAGYFVDPNDGGESNQPRIVDVFWGRLVDVFDEDPGTGQRSLQYTDFVVGQDVETTEDANGNPIYTLESNLVTSKLQLTIHAPNDGDPNGTFHQLLQQAQSGLGPVNPKSLSPTELPPFTLLPRNAALVVRFDDLIDHSTVTPDTVQVRTGYPPITPTDVRLRLDPNHGGQVSSGGLPRFRSTRVIIDSTISNLESLESPFGLEVNNLGLPASINTTDPNVVVRIPTKEAASVGQFDLLENVSGHVVATSLNGPVDFSAPSVPIIRAMRSGGSSAVTGDKFNGFLRDSLPPAVVGAQGVSITQVLDDDAAGEGNFVLDVSFDLAPCATAAQPGDVIELPNAFLEVTQSGQAPAGSVLQDVRVRLIAGSSSDVLLGQALYLSSFDPSVPDMPGCFLTFSPETAGGPTDGVAPSSQVFFRFSEPMDPVSLNPFETLAITHDPSDPTGNPPLLADAGTNDVVVSELVAASDLRQYTLTPILPFSHQNGALHRFSIEMLGGANGVTDLAGNPIGNPLPPVPFTLDANAPTRLTGSVSLRFTTEIPDDGLGTNPDAGGVDEDGDLNSEIRGQFLHDPDAGTIRGRPVARFSGLIDRSDASTLPGAMVKGTTNFVYPDSTLGIRAPLDPRGSKVMSLYRYVDMGLLPNDESQFNIDVERLNWAPNNGEVLVDQFPEFEIALGHSFTFPDELHVNFPPITPILPLSGMLTSSFEENYLDLPNRTVVHPAFMGYDIDALEKFQAPTGTELVPWPLNTGANPSQYRYFTWRDTALLAVGGVVDPTPFMFFFLPFGHGVPPLAQDAAVGNGELTCTQISIPVDPMMPSCAACTDNNGVCEDAEFGVAPFIPSVVLPLLMEFRCHPTSEGLGINYLDVSAGVNNTNVPFFRIHSTGGINPQGNAVFVLPDDEDVPQGGFVENPAFPGSMGGSPLGTRVLPAGDDMYVGQADFVVRVSRVQTRWFDTGTPSATFADPVLFPSLAQLQNGTDIVVAFRGAAAILPGSPALTSAFDLDAYGDEPAATFPMPHYDDPAMKDPSITFLDGDRSWRDELTDLDGSQFVQARITFVANPQTSVVPELSDLGLSFDL